MGQTLLKIINYFIAFLDTPNDYIAGDAGKRVVINTAEDALEFSSNIIRRDGKTKPTADISFDDNKIRSLADPINLADGVNKEFADARILALDAPSTWREYADNTAYALNEVIVERGTMYRVSTAIPAVVRRNAPYGSLTPLNLGVGDAFFQPVPLHATRPWIKVAAVPVYTSGSITIGGLFNGKQANFYFDFTTAYSTSKWSIMFTQHNPTLIEQISLRQPAGGRAVEVWIKQIGTSGDDWNMHMICNAGGVGGDVSFDEEINFKAAPGGVGGHYWDFFIPSGYTFRYTTTNS
ncbi:MAG: hypothetical protein DRI46_14445 [Chloroflexi bacterium]|nr:MAG: hypothetical protein DRI46_14445 [Chloroflexota bacterium]